MTTNVRHGVDKACATVFNQDMKNTTNPSTYAEALNLAARFADHGLDPAHLRRLRHLATLHGTTVDALLVEVL